MNIRHDIVKYLLLESPIKSNIHADNDLVFRMVCRKGHLNAVKYLVESPGIAHANIHAESEEGLTGFMEACIEGRRDIVEYLHPFVDIHQNNELGFRLSALNGRVEVMKYLAPHVDIHAKDAFGQEDAFSFACYNNHQEVIHLLLYDLNFYISPETIDMMRNNPAKYTDTGFINRQEMIEEFIQMIEKRDLLFKLNENLENKNSLSRVNI